jgi:hypothetical protein
LEEFRDVYYDRELDYWDIADTWGVDRNQVDEWRRVFGLPSRRWYGTRSRDDPWWEDPPSRWDYYGGRHSQYYLWDRRRLPGPGLPVDEFPRRLNGEVFWMCI